MYPCRSVTRYQSATNSRILTAARNATKYLPTNGALRPPRVPTVGSHPSIPGTRPRAAPRIFTSKSREDLGHLHARWRMGVPEMSQAGEPCGPSHVACVAAKSGMFQSCTSSAAEPSSSKLLAPPDEAWTFSNSLGLWASINHEAWEKVSLVRSRSRLESLKIL